MATKQELENKIKTLEGELILAKQDIDSVTKSKLESYKAQLIDIVTINKNLGSTHNKEIIELNKSLNSLNTAVASTNSVFGELFTNLAEGFETLVTQANLTTNIFKNPLSDGINFWREYHTRVREIGVDYGISGEKLKDFREDNKKLEESFVRAGGNINDYKTLIGGLFDTLGSISQLTPKLTSDMASLGNVMGGLSVTEVGQIYGNFKNLNISFGETSKILEDLRYSAEKSALNTTKVLKTFTDNFEKLNTYSFKNGVNGMMDMVKQSILLKTNMDSILNLSDQFADPEKTMEFASNMQLLGGTAAQLGDFNQLMYDAAVAPEELTKNIGKAAAGLGVFNKESGKMTYSWAETQQLKEMSKYLNINVTDLQRMGTTVSKISSIKMDLGFDKWTDEQMETIANLAEFKNGRYEVNVGGETKSVATLDEQDMKKLTEVQKESLKDISAQKFTADQLIVNELKGLNYSSIDLFKSVDTEKFRTDIKDVFSEINGFAHEIKDNIFNIIEEGSTKATDMLGDVFKEITTFASGLNEIAKELNNIPKEFGKDNTVKETLSSVLQELFGINLQKKSQGDILEGPSHVNGGIPFTINKKPGFEAEGNEVLLTKGVGEDPMLLAMASKLNEMGGGKKLFESGDKLSENNFNSFENSQKMIESMKNRSNIINNLTTNKFNDFGNEIKNITQGGLINKRADIMSNNMTVNGTVKVDGNISISPVKIGIDSSNTSKEFTLSSDLEKKIIGIVEDRINKMNLYTKFINQKGTGLNEGKSVNIVGVTDQNG